MPAEIEAREAALEDWIERQFRFSAEAMLRAISATHLVKERPGFFQRVVPKKGSVLASPALASYDPDPDYFFHWFRDAALVIDALRLLLEEGIVESAGIERFRDFLGFSLDLRSLSGSAYLDGTLPRPTAIPSYQQFLRTDAELAAVAGEGVMADTRVNADGTLDFIRWTRPQADGSALRALALMRAWGMAGVDDESRLRMRALIEADLAFTARSWSEPTFDIWEEERGHHYYTRLVQCGALTLGAEWMAGGGDAERAAIYAGLSDTIGQALDAHWSDKLGFYRSRVGPATGLPHRTLDVATILAVVHARKVQGPHSVLDPKAQATLAQLEDLFDRDFPINHSRPADQAPAIGRYAGDIYYGGGPFYLSTLGAAEFYFRLAEALASPGVQPAPESRVFFIRAIDIVNAADAKNPSERPESAPELALTLLRRGDMSLATVRAYAPVSGELSEQFDRVTGAQTSAKNLTWSYAAFVTAVAARRRALRRLRAAPA